MVSDYQLREARHKYGRNAIRPEYLRRYDDLARRDTEDLMEAGSAIGGLLGVLLIPFLLIYFLPVIGVYITLAAGAFAWATMMFWWPRYASTLFAVLTVAGLIYGIGGTAEIKFLWLEIGPIVSRDLPMWNGPGTWALAPVAAAPLIMVINMVLVVCRVVPPPFFIDENYVVRDARGLSVYLPVSIMMAITCLMPLMIFVPVILWSGMFGENGFWVGAELTRSEVLRVLMHRPFDIFKAGFHAGIFWPGGFFASIGMLMLYSALALSMVMSVFYCIMRRIEERDVRREKRAAHKAK